MKRKLWKKRLSAFLAAVVAVTSIPFTAVADDTVNYIPEQQIMQEEIPDETFNFASSGAEISEADKSVHRITMIDFSAEYGTDYIVHPE